MTAELYGGQSIELPEGVNVEVIDISESKIRVLYKNQFGYTYVDFLNSEEFRLFEIFYENKMNDRIAAEKKKVQLALLSLDMEYDSIKSLYNDSSMLIIRPKKGIKATVFDSPFKNIIADATSKNVFKVIGASSYSFLKVTGINNSVEGYVYQPHFETTQALLNYIPVLVKQKFGEEIGAKVINHEYWIGMHSSQALVSLGLPQRINETRTTLVITQQWVYIDKYLYFDNDVLTSVQKRY